QFFHVLYMICHRLGYTVTNDPTAHYDVGLVFEDTTVRTSFLPESLGTIINAACFDISKSRVDTIFTEVFGYSTRVDPKVHMGVCVKKPEGNALHAGEVIMCPAQPEEGYIYQKLIDTEMNGEVHDIRVPYYAGIIPFVTLRYRP